MTISHNPAASSPDPLPLAGKRILVTRAPHQASGLADQLRGLGAIPILVPTIEIGPPTSFAALDAALAAVSSYDLVAFTSANAVEVFHARATVLGLTPQPKRVAVVGSSTARALTSFGLHPDVIPATFTAEALSHELLPEAAGSHILLVLAEDAPTLLHDALVAGGAEVIVAAAYRNRIPKASLAAIRSLFANPSDYPDVVTFTSASTAENLVALLRVADLVLPESVVRASIGPITSRALRHLQLPPHVEAAESTIPALIAALAAYFRPSL